MLENRRQRDRLQFRYHFAYLSLLTHYGRDSLETESACNKIKFK